MAAHSEKRRKKSKTPNDLSFAGFAAEHRLNPRSDVDGTTVIFGRRGQIFEYCNGRLGVLLQPGRASVWPRTRKKLIDAGFEIVQNGDREGTALFDPANSDQARLAIRVAGAKKKRKASAKQLQNLKKGPARNQFASPGTGGEGAAM